jgi:plasmid stabilization system protein ParE
MHATTEGGRNPKVRQQPTPSRHRSRPLSHSVRRLAQAPPAPFIDGRKSVASPPRQHTRINMRATTEGGRNPKVRQQPTPSRHRSRLLSQTVRRLAQAPPTPFIDGRKSVASPTRANMRATTEGGRNPKVRQQPTPSRHRSRLLSHSVRRLAQAPPTPFIDGRKSVASRAHTNMRANPEGAEILRSGPVNACPVAPSLSDTSPDHVPARESTSGPVHRWSKIGRVARPHQCACNDREGRNPTVRQTAFVTGS